MAGKISDQIKAPQLNGEEWLLLAYDGQNYKVTINELLGQVPLPTLAALGLDHVDNTADLDKPLSLAVMQALNNKADHIHRHSVADIDGLADALQQKADISTVNQTIQDLLATVAQKGDLQSLEASIHEALVQYATTLQLEQAIQSIKMPTISVVATDMEW
ncbi:MAG: hypothetical protein ACR2HF_02150 [Methylococcaceae bacterium]